MRRGWASGVAKALIGPAGRKWAVKASLQFCPEAAGWVARDRTGLWDLGRAVAWNRKSVNVGCKTDPLRRGGLGALAALLRRCHTLTAGPRWARGPLEPPGPRSGRGTGRKEFPGRRPPPSQRGLGPYLNVDSLFPLFCRLVSGIMAQRAFPNPYADYNKSLAEGYFDSAGRVSLGNICLHPYLQIPVFGKEFDFAWKKGMTIPF